MEIREIKPKRGKYRTYDIDVMQEAFSKVIDSGLPIGSVAKTYGVPQSTLRDRIKGRISVDVVKSGRDPMFSAEEEAFLCNHLKIMAEVGYGYTRKETLNLASDYAVHLERKTNQKNLSLKWLYNFLGRWPELRVQKGRSLEIMRAQCSSKEVLGKYFQELENILDKYNLKDQPHRIFNIDEKGITTDNKPPNVVSGSTIKPQVITAGKSKTVTLIGGGGASGSQIPPYFVFPGQRMLPDLLKGATPGVDGTVSESGWSNSYIFEKYMKEHFVKFIPNRDNDNKVLVLYDGHKSHISMNLITWAKEHNIILFVLPPHTSHILQPMDVSCFGPFEVAWGAACHSFLRTSGGQVITRYDVCNLACSVYVRTITPQNILSAFKKCGIFPFCPEVIPDSAVAPSLAFPLPVQSSVPATDVVKDEATQEPSTSANKDNVLAVQNNATIKTTNSGCSCKSQTPAMFLENRGGQILGNVKVKKERRTMSKVVAGKAITEDSVVESIMEHYQSQTKKSTGRKRPSENNKENDNNNNRQHTSTMGEIETPTKKGKTPSIMKGKTPTKQRKVTKSIPKEITYMEDSESDVEVTDEEKCCACGLFQPIELKGCVSLVFTKWAQCDVCGHWVHLRYCTVVRDVRRHDKFLCSHCQ